MKIEEERVAARRPFYEVNGSKEPLPSDEQTPAFGVGARETGRLERLRARQSLGPGCYEIEPLVPGGPATTIAPEPAPLQLREEQKPPPGPADYDLERADELMYPRQSVAEFDWSRGHTHQKTPRYVARYSALEPRWEALRRRSLSAVILPVARERLLPSNVVPTPDGPTPGPGHYLDADGGDDLVRRLRPDVLVTQWMKPRSRSCEPEHVRGLFNDRPVDRTVRGDPRPLIGHEDDWILRRRHPAPVIHPLTRSLPDQEKVEDDARWCFYEPAPWPEPEGLASFSRHLAFEEFDRAEAVWERRHLQAERRWHPNRWLSYSMPCMEVASDKPRAPHVDFSLVPGRPSSDAGNALDSPREGDVLLLDTGAEKELLHPRVLQIVDMGRQLGRPDDAVPDDFEELIIDPKPVQRRTPVFVDMALGSGRPVEPQFSANLWADVNGTVYAYQPTAGLQLREPGDDVLDLELPWAKVRHRAPMYDFERPLGRPGVDPRVDDHALAGGESVILTHWSPPTRQPRFRCRAARRVSATDPLSDAVAEAANGSLDEPNGAEPTTASLA